MSENKTISEFLKNVVIDEELIRELGIAVLNVLRKHQKNEPEMTYSNVSLSINGSLKSAGMKVNNIDDTVITNSQRVETKVVQPTETPVVPSVEVLHKVTKGASHSKFTSRELAYIVAKANELAKEKAGLTHGEFCYHLCKKCGFLMPYATFLLKVCPKVNYEFTSAIGKNKYAHPGSPGKNMKDMLALIQCGMRIPYALSLCSLAGHKHRGKYRKMSSKEVLKHINSLYAENKQLMDAYVERFPGEFRFPNEILEQEPTHVKEEATSEKSKPDTTENPRYFRRLSPWPFTRSDSSLYGLSNKTYAAIQEIAQTPNLTKMEFMNELCKKLGVIISFRAWTTLTRRCIIYKFKNTKNYDTSKDRISDCASLTCIGVSIDAARCISKCSFTSRRIFQDKTDVSEERVRRLYTENKVLFEYYAKRDPKFKLPEFCESDLKKEEVKQQESVIEEKPLPVSDPCEDFKQSIEHKRKVRLDCENVSPVVVEQLCDMYEKTGKDTLVEGDSLLKLTAKRAGYPKMSRDNLKKLIFGHQYMGKMYEGIAVPIQREKKASTLDPNILNFVEKVKYLRSHGIPLQRIIEIFQDADHTSLMIEKIYYEITFTQLGRYPNDSARIWADTRYGKEYRK